MPRYIDADLMLSGLSDDVLYDSGGYRVFIRAWLESQPTIDAVPVVRCGECRIGGPSTLGDGWIYCQNNKLHHQKSHFCSYGEKMEDKPCE